MTKTIKEQSQGGRNSKTRTTQTPAKTDCHTRDDESVWIIQIHVC